jgi:hypothetical protein
LILRRRSDYWSQRKEEKKEVGVDHRIRRKQLFKEQNRKRKERDLLLIKDMIVISHHSQMNLILMMNM